MWVMYSFDWLLDSCLASAPGVHWPINLHSCSRRLKPDCPPQHYCLTDDTEMIGKWILLSSFSPESCIPCCSEIPKQMSNTCLGWHSLPTVPGHRHKRKFFLSSPKKTCSSHGWTWVSTAQKDSLGSEEPPHSFYSNLSIPKSLEVIFLVSSPA